MALLLCEQLISVLDNRQSLIPFKLGDQAVITVEALTPGIIQPAMTDQPIQSIVLIAHTCQKQQLAELLVSTRSGKILPERAKPRSVPVQGARFDICHTFVLHV
jgi:hypothetical protein